MRSISKHVSSAFMQRIYANINLFVSFLLFSLVFLLQSLLFPLEEPEVLRLLFHSLR